MIPPRPLVAGNWKMNGSRASLAEIALVREAVGDGRRTRAETVLCPPFTLIAAAADACRGGALLIGAQDCHVAPSGAHTGDVSAEMLRDAGAAFVIVGHSERRIAHGETDALVRGKAEAAARAGLVAVICVGETRAEHDGGETLRVVGRQIDESLPSQARSDHIVIAYEPVWAIGSGLVPSVADITEVHAFIRRRLAGMLADGARGIRLLYGGSVKPANARALSALPDVDGFLVGGASLVSRDFIGIMEAYM